ncbi:MAG: hypothetical protein Ct9H90mP22_1690 [Gammaproteobacteria bacterium]|nr:MAG: hypothetical protein Ct9H90mP22_1690 [Gammaproteobacteria bacterium]
MVKDSLLEPYEWNGRTRLKPNTFFLDKTGRCFYRGKSTIYGSDAIGAF